MEQNKSAAELLIASIEHTRNDGTNVWNLRDDYEYEGQKLVRRTETDRDSGQATTFHYTYANNFISTVTSHAEDNTLLSEISINYDEENRVVSYQEHNHSNGQTPSSWLATFAYENDRVLHCDGQTWSSVEYKDVYDDVYIYTTNANGEQIVIERIADCAFSASPTLGTGLNATIAYDNMPAPFSNIAGNTFLLNAVIGIFTKSAVTGVHNNATALTGYRDGETENQSWSFEYNEKGYPKTIQWTVNDSVWEDITLNYQEVGD